MTWRQSVVLQVVQARLCAKVGYIIALRMRRKIRFTQPTCWMSPIFRCISSDISGKLIQHNLVQNAGRACWPLAVSKPKHTPLLCNQALTNYSHTCTASNLCPCFSMDAGLDLNNLTRNVPAGPAGYNSPAHPSTKSYSVQQRRAFVIRCQRSWMVQKWLIHQIWCLTWLYKLPLIVKWAFLCCCCMFNIYYHLHNQIINAPRQQNMKWEDFCGLLTTKLIKFIIIIVLFTSCFLLF